MDKYTYLGNSSAAFLEEEYSKYKKDPESVEFGWRKFFEGFEFSKEDYSGDAVPENVQKEFKVIQLINAYRQRGHLFTYTNPVRARRTYQPTLDIENFGLKNEDLDTIFNAGSEIGIGPASLRHIEFHLHETYCKSLGVEYTYIRHPEKFEFLRERMESIKNTPNYSAQEKRYILNKLNHAVEFEQFLHKKFVGQKRFSLQGGESLIPALDGIIEKGSDLGAKEFVIGMAHRGRLNVLANTLHKTHAEIFSEFEGMDYEDSLFDGDVKYHLGFTADVVTENGDHVHLLLAPNPSHLEAVGPVVEGIVRSKIDRYLSDDSKIVPIIIHGDASIAGQGVVYEVVQMAGLKGYKTGGTVHIVINNQIGFTTNYIDARTSTYCTDVGKVTLCPIFHVNGDDVEMVTYAVQLAMEYRQRFKSDVFIDLLCYRKYGHNEGDEPRFTQPLLYKAIENHPNPRDMYVNDLVEQGVVTKEEAEKVISDFAQSLDDMLEASKKIGKTAIHQFLIGTWKGYGFGNSDDMQTSLETGFKKADFLKIGKKITELPGDKKFFKKSVRLMKDRDKMLNETGMLDWGMGETMAYGTLLAEGYRIRISGQDVERGTFSHRHAILTLEDSEEHYIPLANVEKNKGFFKVYNSLLSEYAVLGYEYGYAMAAPETLTIWEAQFGDFSNGAQIIMDQFIAAGEDKWKVRNGMVMLLPHGYEGQGAEHSSARIERYLTLCADDNMIAVNATTPANFYHLLRRQMHRNFRKPLIVFTPKSLLRHPRAQSPIDDFTKGRFLEIIDDEGVKAAEAESLVFCSGKLYYDLMIAREERKISNVALVRIEQLFPWPEKQIAGILKKYNKVKKVVFAQEEPENMGPWPYVIRMFKYEGLELVSRRASGSPASGSHKTHVIRQQEVVDKALSIK
ncbi:MAG: 2-oxoglutarate dehydrogenase E1 component [Vicingaceae bacterium]